MAIGQWQCDKTSPLVPCQYFNIKAHTLMLNKLAQDFLISKIHSVHQGSVAIVVCHIGGVEVFVQQEHPRSFGIVVLCCPMEHSLTNNIFHIHINCRLVQQQFHNLIVLPPDSDYQSCCSTGTLTVDIFPTGQR